MAFFFRAESSKEDEEDLTSHVQKVLFIVIIGCEDDAASEKAQFINKALRIQLYDKLCAFHTTTKSDELKPLVKYTMDKLEATARALLNVAIAGKGEEAGVSAGAGAADNGADSARKRRAEEAAERRAKIMAAMNKAQRRQVTHIKHNKSLFKMFKREVKIFIF